jgi:hypothetical protein
MSSSCSRATSQFEVPVRMEMPILLYPRCRAAVDRRISRTSKNTNRPFYVCNSEKRVRTWKISVFCGYFVLNMVDLFRVLAAKMLLPLGRCFGPHADASAAR